MGEYPLLSVAVRSGQKPRPRKQGAGQAPAGLMQRGCQASSRAPCPPGTRDKASQLAVSPVVFRVLARGLEHLRDPGTRNCFSTHEKGVVPSSDRLSSVPGRSLAAGTTSRRNRQPVRGSRGDLPRRDFRLLPGRCTCVAPAPALSGNAAAPVNSAPSSNMERLLPLSTPEAGCPPVSPRKVVGRPRR